MVIINCQLNGCSASAAVSAGIASCDTSGSSIVDEMGIGSVAEGVTSTVWWMVITQSGKTNEATAVDSSTMRLSRCQVSLATSSRQKI
jgi:hypothetical protein